MHVAVFVTSESDAASLIPWGVRFAAAKHLNLLVVAPRKSKGKRAWDPLLRNEADENSLYEKIFQIIDCQDSEQVVLKQDIAEHFESTDHDRILIETRELIAPAPESAFVEEVLKMDIQILLVPAAEHSKSDSDQEIWSQQLFLTAPCEVMMVRGTPAESMVGEPLRVLVVSQGDNDTDIALQRGQQLVKSTGGTLTFLYVRPDDDFVASRVAAKNLERLVSRALGRDTDLVQRTALAPNLVEGIKGHDLGKYDLVLLGSRSSRLVKQFFRGLESTEQKPIAASVATIREAVPMASRLWGKIQTAVRGKVPQLDRDLRVKLVDRLQNNSRFDFDFIALISLSTLIAALGLIRNSASVVIGAMLVAPLMTPLVGIGFSLVQGNWKLVRVAMRSVVSVSYTHLTLPTTPYV